MTVTPEQVAERIGHPSFANPPKLLTPQEHAIHVHECLWKACERIAELENEQFRIKQGLRMRDELVRDGVITPRNK